MTLQEWTFHRDRYVALFNEIPLESRGEAEALFQAFRSRILCELFPPMGGSYGCEVGRTGDGARTPM